MSYKDFFKDKKIAIIGVGEHGAMIADIKFLMKLRAHISIYELRSRDKLGGSEAGSVAREIEGICASAQVSTPASCLFGLMSHLSTAKSRADISKEIAGADLIILSPEVPRNVDFLKEARDAGVRIEYPDTLLFKLIPSSMLIAVMGSVAKTAVSHMLFSLLKRSNTEEQIGVFLVNVEDGGALSSLKKIKKNDIIIARMPEHMMEEYRLARITPHIAVLTHVSKSLAQMGERFFGILEFQTYNSFIVASDASVDMLKDQGGLHPKAKVLRTRPSTIPADWYIKSADAHIRENAALVVEVSKIFKIDPDVVHLALADARPLKGRLEKLKVNKAGVEFYNDTMSVRPESTLAALRVLSADAQGRSIILILGGSYTGASYDELLTGIPRHVSAVVLLPGTGTFTERPSLEKMHSDDNTSTGWSSVKILHSKSVREAVNLAKEIAKKGDRVLFSPAFDIAGSFESREARGNEFVKAVRYTEEISLG